MKQKTRKHRYREITNAIAQGYQSIVIELCENYIKDFPEDWAVWSFYARALSDSSRYREAKFWFLKLIKEFEHSNSKLLKYPYSRLGDLYKRKGNYIKASEWYNKASEFDPDEATYLILLGVSQYRLGKFDKAETILKQATRCKKGCIDEAFYNLGVLLASQKRYREALINFEKAVEIDPKYKLAKRGIKDIKRVLELLKIK